MAGRKRALGAQRLLEGIARGTKPAALELRDTLLMIEQMNVGSQMLEVRIYLLEPRGAVVAQGAQALGVVGLGGI
jgi:hypothetical protein